MHYAQATRNSRKARQEAEQLFKSFRSPILREVAKIVYPTRFRFGECVIAALLPIDRETVRRFAFICEAHRGYHYPPVVISGEDGRRLRLMWRFPMIRPSESIRLLQYATIVARWVNDVFHHQSIIYPAGGIMDVRIRLQAFD